MKVIEQSDATASLAQYADQIDEGAVIVTHHGKAVAALVPIDEEDFDSMKLSMHPKFMEIIARSLASVQTHGTIPLEEIRRRFANDAPHAGSEP